MRHRKKENGHGNFMIVLDTNIIIDHLRRGDSGETILMKLAGDIPPGGLAVSLITIQELYEGQSTRDEEKEKSLLATLAPLKILPYTYDVAELAGKIARDRKRPMEFADAAIAATAVFHEAPLCTLNTKDFWDISGLVLYTI